MSKYISKSIHRFSSNSKLNCFKNVMQFFFFFSTNFNHLTNHNYSDKLSCFAPSFFLKSWHGYFWMVRMVVSDSTKDYSWIPNMMFSRCFGIFYDQNDSIFFYRELKRNLLFALSISINIKLSLHSIENWPKNCRGLRMVFEGRYRFVCFAKGIQWLKLYIAVGKKGDSKKKSFRTEQKRKEFQLELNGLWGLQKYLKYLWREHGKNSQLCIAAYCDRKEHAEEFAQNITPFPALKDACLIEQTSPRTNSKRSGKLCVRQRTMTLFVFNCQMQNIPCKRCSVLFENGEASKKWKKERKQASPKS